MQKVLAAIVIGIVLVGAGIYLYSNSQRQREVSSKTGEYSKEVNNYPEAKASRVVELKNGDTYDLTASIVKKNINGADVKMLAYNGSIPGPLIKVPQNA
ncbi:MAG TPA: hypothetical protein PLS49_02915, partial [Candidatus Woesebacteria bacterium]|nr:hypothetical protein [Candidatus Woesebacteria bacterium]